MSRFLPGDFEAFDAFDEAGNPPVHLWTRYLQVEVPTNWFALFEEARRKQREWKGGIEEQQHRPSQLLSPHSPPSTNILTDDHQRIISDYALQSSSIPVSSSAAASTNIVDPTADSLLSSVSSLPMDSRPLGLFSDYRSIGDTVTSASTPAAPDFPRPPSTVPGLLDRDELRKHLQDDLDKFQHEPGANNSCDTGGRRPSSTSLSSPPRSEKNYSSNNVLRHHASFTNIASTSPNSNNNSKRQSIHSFFSKHSQKQQ
ncbi:hypothetical protein BDB00DRAFT_808857 [Zychaea mexicana]|uniref:uncharacterized protein n=1 Tax=Zychaea mexicana TaxID=64656 RepID=UPI0022FE9E52|nr:uncharacterized protein BDB00DRAFT_808857 [Zychaea mexicana]KAI9496429.1 hypothetical protein BDB00DRAFT_808857 [Zychaea mexicana]